MIQRIRDLALRYQINEDSLRERLRDLPEDLASLCIDLLSPDVNLRPLGNEVIQRLGAEDRQSLSFAAESCCLGRENELQRITDAFEASATSGRIVLVRGESGIGKTTLLKHWTRALARADNSTLLLYVGCHLQDHTPLRALNLLAQQLVTHLPELPREIWEDLTANEGAEIVYGFPKCSSGERGTS